MDPIAFLNSEIERGAGKTKDIGAIRDNGAISLLNTGDELKVDGEYGLDAQGRRVFRFSKQMIFRIEGLRNRQYVPVKAKIRYIVYWRREGEEREVRILLPDLSFERLEG